MSDLFAVATIITAVFSGIATGITAFGTSSCSKVACTRDGVICEMTKRSHPPPPTPDPTSGGAVKSNGVKDTSTPPPPSDSSKVDPLSKDGEVVINPSVSQYDANDKAETIFSAETNCPPGTKAVDKRLPADGKLPEPSVGGKTNFKLPNSDNSIDVITKSSDVKRSYVNANVDIVSNQETSLPIQKKNNWSKLKARFNQS